MLIDTIYRSNFGSQESIIQNNNGISLIFDNTRSKWLSTSRNCVDFFINNDVIYDQWMIHNMWSNLQGYNIDRNSTITLISTQTKNNTSGIFKIITNNTVLYSIELNNESKKIIDDLNIDISTDNSIKVLLEVKNTVKYPILKIEYAWR